MVVLNGDDKLPSKSGSFILKKAVDFSWENLNFFVPVKDKEGKVTQKQLLHNLSGIARAGRVLGIMGPSGAGKTTFMRAISGRLYGNNAVLEGSCYLNNTMLSDRYKKLLSYVSQDDIVMGKETPREAIAFSCRVRLGLSVEETNDIVDGVIKRLYLEDCQNTILGIPGILKGVSGGERKRVNVASEFVTNPCVIMLDEPTTGLDSVNALNLGQLLHDMAKNDMRTVIATLHSPSSELLDMFDDLLLFSNGHVIYHGPTSDSVAYFAGLGYEVPQFTNPSEYYMKILQLPEEKLSELWLAWEDHVRSPEAASNPCLFKPLNEIKTEDAFLDENVKIKGAGYGTQFVELWKRSFRMYRRDPGTLYNRLYQTLFFSLFLGLFFFNVQLNQNGVQDRLGVLYIAMTKNLFEASMHGISAYPPERAVFLQEQSNNSYNAIIYVLAKYAAELPFQVLFPTIFTLISYFMVHLYRSPEAFFVHWFIVVLITTTGYSFGFMFATFFRTSTPAFALVPIIFLPLLIVSGLFANTARLVPYWVWMNWISFPRYAYSGLFVNEFSRLSVICKSVTEKCIYPNGDFVINQMGFKGWHYWESFLGLIVLQVFFLTVGAVVLFFKGRKRQKKINFSKKK